MKTHLILLCAIGLGGGLVYGATNPINPSQDKPTVLYVSGYNPEMADHWHQRSYWSDGSGDILYDTSWGLQWSDGGGGSGHDMVSYKACSSDLPKPVIWSCESQSSWPATTGPDLAHGTTTADTCATTVPHECPPPTLYQEHCAVSDPTNYTVTDGNTVIEVDETYNRTADTKMTLFTGGKAVAGRQNLFILSGSASEILDKHRMLPFGYTVRTRPIPVQNIQILGKALGSDGNLYVVLPDNQTLDATPHVNGVDYYTFDVGARKYTPYITDNGTKLEPDESNVTNCVGQKITFGVDGLPGGSANSYRWSFSGEFVNHSWQQQDEWGNGYGSVNYDIDLSLMNVTEPYVWYVSKGDKNAYVNVDLYFSNGQNVTINPSGKFSVFKPNVVMVDPHQNGTPTVIWEDPWYFPERGAIQLGVPSLAQNMSYLLRVISSDFSGDAEIIQLCNIDASGLNGSCSGCLDGGGAYTSTHVQKNPNPTGGANILNLDDAPDANGYISLHMNDSFVDYVMFKPDGDGIYVNIAKVLWSVNAHVSYPDSDINQNVTGPTGPTDSDEFPRWTNTR